MEEVSAVVECLMKLQLQAVKDMVQNKASKRMNKSIDFHYNLNKPSMIGKNLDIRNLQFHKHQMFPDFKFWTFIVAAVATLGVA